MSEKLYQAHFKMPRNRTFALPVFGTKRTIWDALAKHMHYTSYRKWVEVTERQHKDRFVLVEVQS